MKYVLAKSNNLVHIQLTLKYLPDSFCGNKYKKYTCNVCKAKRKTGFLHLISPNNMSLISVTNVTVQVFVNVVHLYPAVKTLQRHTGYTYILRS